MIRLATRAAVLAGSILLAVSLHAQNLLVLPFENVARDSRLEWLGEGLAELSAERLAGGGRVVFSREEWLGSLEKLGLPSSGRFSRATMIKIAEEVDADFVVFGSYQSDGRTLTATARVLHLDPPALSEPLVESGPLDDLLRVHARLAWRVLRALNGPAPDGAREEAGAPMMPRLDAFEQYIRGLVASDEAQRVRYLREAARLAPDWPPAAFALAQACFARRDFAAAAGWFGRVPAGHRHAIPAAFFAGVSHLMRNDAPRAEVAFSILLERARVAEGFNNLGVALARQEKWREAYAQWQQAQRLEPGEPDYAFNAALAALRNNEPAAAVKPLREVLRGRPDDPDARGVLLLALERSGRTTEAAAERENFSPRIPAALPPPRMKMQLAALPALNGSSRAPSHRLAHARLHFSRGQEALRAGRADDAQREFSEAVLIDPEMTDARLGLAESYRRQGKTDEAVRELRAALWGREDAGVRVALARVLLEQNRPGEARVELRAALKADPSNREARDLLGALDRAGDSGARK
jgi:Tfp pilus assembly protein PilF/TolB-like protein